MARPRKTIPTLCENARGYLFAKDRNGKQHWFGPATDPASGERYAAFIAKIQRGDMIQAVSRPRPRRVSFSVSELCLRFLTQYATRYRKSDGKPSAEVDCFKSAILHLRKLFGETSVNDFGPLRLQVVRQSMIDAGWSRRWINKQIGRIRLMFRVGVSWELVRSEVLTALKSVPSLTVGESTAPETEPRTAIPDADLKAVRAILPELHRDIFDLLLLSGARPGELLCMTTGMINRSEDTWRCELRHHKTAKKGKGRTLYFIAAAQRILMKYLKSKPDERIFPIQRNSYGHAIRRACEKAEVKPFVPHQLRHTVATRLADDLGTEAAQRLLGHTTRAMTEHYSRSAERLALEAVKTLR